MLPNVQSTIPTSGDETSGGETSDDETVGDESSGLGLVRTSQSFRQFRIGRFIALAVLTHLLAVLSRRLAVLSRRLAVLTRGRFDAALGRFVTLAVLTQNRVCCTCNLEVVGGLCVHVCECSIFTAAQTPLG